MMAIATIQVQGMSCQHCVQSVKTAVSEVTGVSHCEVDLTSGLVTIHYADELNGTKQLLDSACQAISEQGYDVVET